MVGRGIDSVVYTAYANFLCFAVVLILACLKRSSENLILVIRFSVPTFFVFCRLVLKRLIFWHQYVVLFIEDLFLAGHGAEGWKKSA